MTVVNFKTAGVCSKGIHIELDGQVIAAIKFIGGCRGNLQAVSALTKGRTIAEILPLIDGIQCRNGTSCADQLAKALRPFMKSVGRAT